jgi:transglutaminase-like putative cysteine protease
MLMVFAAITSFYLTDYHRSIRLGDWAVNVVILIIVFCTLGEILHNRGEDLAFSIVRVLVFVEMILLFREKTPRFCWQILLISFLQVIVASVLQQSLFFVFLLITYVFIGLCNFVLIFLRQENIYFRNHSFVGTFFDSLRAEIAERQDRGKLVRIALITLLTGPLSLVFSFSNSEKKQLPANSDYTNPKNNPNIDPKLSPKKILRSLFVVFPNEQDANRSGVWETVSPNKLVIAATASTAKSVPVNSNSVANSNGVIPQKELVPVPSSGRSPLSRRHRNNVESRSRFPLLLERPGFSGGTMSVSPMEGGLQELFGHLVRGTFFAMLFAIVLFCLIPRIGRIEIGGFSVKMGHEYWAKPFIRPVGTVGFNEEIRLGSLGTVIPYHREVMSVRMTKIPTQQLPATNSNHTQEIPYNEINGATLYFRGIALDTYANGSWKPRKISGELFSNLFKEKDSLRRDIDSRSFHVLFPGRTVRTGDSSRLFFNDGCDLVSLNLTIKPLDTMVFFAPWPFFYNRADGTPPTRFLGNFISERRLRREDMTTTIYTTAFKHGTQLALIPCQELFNQDDLLQIPEQGLDSLKALAAKWDAESGIPKENVIARASNMEWRFLQSDHFKYQFGGIIRNYHIDPLEDFIERNPAGHCEYFAGALALMLRSVGIQARVIVGFKTHAANPSSHGYVVRQSDAHAWVNVYLPPETIPKYAEGPYAEWWANGGWLRLDPSPSAEPTMMKSVSFNLIDLDQWIQTMWGEFVLNMNSSKQIQWIYQPIRTGFHHLIYRSLNIEFWKEIFSETFQNYKHIGNGVRWQARDWGYLAVHTVIFVLFIWGTWKVFWRLRGLVHGSSGRGRRRATIDFYIRMERLFSRIGLERRSEETPLEFIRQTGYTALSIPIINAYYRVRFGSAELTDEELQTVRQSLDQLEKNILESLHRPKSVPATCN